MILMINHKGKL